MLHGKFVLTARLAGERATGEGMIGQVQIIEDHAHVALSFSDGGGDAVAGSGLDEADGEAG